MICKHCGNEIGKDSIFCPKCGEKKAEEDAEADEGLKRIVSENEEPKKKFSFKIIISVLVGILILAGGCFWLTSSANKPQKDRLLYIKDNEIYFMDFDGQENTVDAYVRYLRAKIDLPNHKSLIETVRGIGYRLNNEN